MVTSLNARSATQKQLASRISKVGERIGLETQKFGNCTETLSDIFNETDPTKPAAAQVVRVAKGAQSMAAKVEAIKASIDQIFGQEMAAILDRKLAKVPLHIKDAAYAREIRDRVVAMPDRDVITLLATLAATNKAAELAAITQVSPILSGVTETVQARFRDLIFETHAPQEIADERALMADYDTAIQAYTVARATAGDYSNDRTVAAILNAEQRAVNADARLAQAMAS